MVDYDEMLRQHQSVLADVDRLKLMLTSPPDTLAPGRARQLLVRDIDALRSDLVEHFRFEEEGGYLEIVTGPRPGLSSKVAALKEHHVEILRRLDRLVGGNEELDFDAMKSETTSVLALLRKHEAAEDSLVRRAVNEDMGVGD